MQNATNSLAGCGLIRFTSFFVLAIQQGTSGQHRLVQDNDQELAIVKVEQSVDANGSRSSSDKLPNYRTDQDDANSDESVEGSSLSEDSESDWEDRDDEKSKSDGEGDLEEEAVREDGGVLNGEEQN